MNDPRNLRGLSANVYFTRDGDCHAMTGVLLRGVHSALDVNGYAERELLVDYGTWYGGNLCAS